MNEASNPSGGTSPCFERPSIVQSHALLATLPLGHNSFTSFWFLLQSRLTCPSNTNLPQQKMGSKPLPTPESIYGHPPKRSGKRSSTESQNPHHPDSLADIDAKYIFTSRLIDGPLVKGKNLIRHHADSDSEDAESSCSCYNHSPVHFENGGHECKAEEMEADNNKRPIGLRDHELTPRFASCVDCGEEFDVTLNVVKFHKHASSLDREWPCTWHSGMFPLP